MTETITIHSHSGKRHIAVPTEEANRYGERVALCSPYTWGTATVHRVAALRRWHHLTEESACERAMSEPECKLCARAWAKQVQA